MTTKKELEKENKSLKDKLNREQSKKICYRCNGIGEIFTYWDGDTHCPACSGSGRC